MRASRKWTGLLGLWASIAALSAAAVVGLSCGGDDAPVGPGNGDDCGTITETITSASRADLAQLQQGRVVIIEHFTNDRCIPCKPVEVALAALIDSLGYDDVVTIGNHLYWPNASDRIYVANSQQFRDRGDRFAVANMPSVWIDGVKFSEPTNLGAMITRVNDASAVAAPYSIAVTGVVEGDNFVVTAVVTKTAESPTADDKLLVLALESGLSYEATAGEQVHYDDAPRSFLTGVAGKDLDLEVSQSKTFRYTITMCDEWVSGNLEAIAFVQSASTKAVHGAGSTY
jgi:hypothetical protein